MSRRIILFGPLPPPYGGVAIYMKALAAHLHHSNVRVWTYGGAQSNNAGTPVRFIAHRKLGTLWALIAEGREARILDASHFHLEYPNPLLLPIWLLLKPLMRFEWYKNVLDGSLPKRYSHFGATQRWLFHQAVKSVDQFVVVSEELKRWLKEEIKVRQPVTVIPCLLTNPWDDGETKLSNQTAELIKPYLAHDKRVCSIGVFFQSYGFKEVAEAVENLREATKVDIGLILLDGAFVRDDGYRCQTLRERDWITVLEKVPHHESQVILKRSDAFVRAVADEGYGISRIEALWCGTPVVATRTGETRGMQLYDFGDKEQLVSRLHEVLLGQAPEDISAWADHYRREAQHNLEAVIKVLGVEGK